MKKILILLIPIMFFASAAIASPSISSTDGTMRHGEDVELIGNDFLTKPEANPLSWDTFESGTAGVTPTLGTDWQAVGSLEATITGARHINSTYSAGSNFDKEMTAGVQSDNATNSEQWFVSYWWKVASDWDWGMSFSSTYNTTLSADCTIGTNVLYVADASGFDDGPRALELIDMTTDPWTRDTVNYDGKSGNALLNVSGVDAVFVSGKFAGNTRMLSNIKFVRYWNSSGSINENVAASTQGWGNGTSVSTEYTAGDVTTSLESGYKESWTKDTWHLFQFEFIENSAVTVADGEFRMWRDGALIANVTNLVTREDFTDFKRIALAGFYNSWGATTDPTNEIPNRFYMDDVYVDTSLARVEIGDAPVYNDCAHREIQIAQIWADGSITIDLNTGSFNLGDTIYIFVVDNTGDVSSGYAVVIGSTEGVITTSLTGNIQLSGGITI